MTTLTTIEFGLNKLLQEARQLRLDLVAEGRAAKMTDPKGPSIHSRLDAMDRKAHLIMRDLKSRDAFHGMLLSKVPSLPQNARFAAKQSNQNAMHEVKRLLVLAEELLGTVAGGFGKATTPTTADIVEGMNAVADEFSKSLNDLQVHAMARHVTDGPEYSSQGRLPGVVGAADVITQVWLVLSCFVAICRRKPS